MSQQLSNHRPSARLPLAYAGLILAVALVGAAGLVAFYVYRGLARPDAAGAGLWLLAAAAGLAAFFSPCSFGLLATLLARETGARDADADRPRLGRALQFAGALALGATLFLIVFGAALAAGAGALLGSITFTSTAGRVLRLVVGLGLVGLGLFQAGERAWKSGPIGRLSNALLNRQARLRRQRPTLAFGLFGFGYVLAGFG
jgi:cytochrome c biogenesis protein CcdA